ALDRLWLLGGYAGDASGMKDAWWSLNGRDWYQDSISVPWSSRCAGLTLGFENRAWLMGGSGAAQEQHDVWSISLATPLVSGLGGTMSWVYGRVLNAAQ